MKPIVIVTPEHEGTIGYFAKGFYNGFKKLGFNTHLLSLEQPNIRELINQYYINPPQFLVSLTGRFIFRGHNLAETLQVPCFMYPVDQIVHFPDILNSTETFIGCIDRSDYFLLKDYKGIKGAFFLPHAVNEELCEDFEKEVIYPVSFFGKGFDFEMNRRSWPVIFPKTLVSLMEEAVEANLQNKCEGFSTFLLKNFYEKGLEGNIYHASRCVEDYLRGYCRFEILKNLKGIQVHLFGRDSWSPHLSKLKNVIYHGPKSFEEVVQAMRQSRIVLNCSPTIRQGGHERIFYGMASQCLVFSEQNNYLQEIFQDDEISYYPKYLKELPDLIDGHLSQHQQSLDKAKRAHNTTLLKHTWEKRVQTFMNACSSQFF